MSKKYRSDFEKFIAAELGEKRSQIVHEELNLPSHSVTITYKNPAKAQHRVIIAFSNLLGVHPYELYRDHDLGKDRLDPIEINYHFEDYKIKQLLEEAA